MWKTLVGATITTLLLPAQDGKGTWEIPQPKEVRASWFPASRVQLEYLRDHADYQALRQHAWRLLDMITEPVARNSRVPLWLTWCTREEALVGCDSTPS